MNKTQTLKEFSERYFFLLKETLHYLNLTSIDNYQDFYLKQILDSTLPLHKSPLFIELIQQKKLLIDIGFGGGFPLLPLTYSLQEEFAFKDFLSLGFESKRKKVEAVRLIKNDLKIEGVQLYHHNVEDILFDCSCVITLKAVGSCKEYLKKIQVLDGHDVYVFFYKGPNFLQLEAPELKQSMNRWELVEERFMELSGLEGRWLVGFKNIVPHGTNKLKRTKSNKLLVNLSDFLKNFNNQL